MQCTTFMTREITGYRAISDYRWTPAEDTNMRRLMNVYAIYCKSSAGHKSNLELGAFWWTLEIVDMAHGGELKFWLPLHLLMSGYLVWSGYLCKNFLYVRGLRQSHTSFLKKLGASLFLWDCMRLGGCHDSQCNFSCLDCMMNYPATLHPIPLLGFKRKLHKLFAISVIYM